VKIIALLVAALAAVAAPTAAAASPADELPQRFDGCLAEPVPAPAAPSPPRARAAAGPSVRRTIRDAAEKGAIAPEDAARYEAEYERALDVRKRIPYQRRLELTSVVRTLEGFARDRTLTVSRMPVLFRQLAQNTDWWSQNGPPVRPMPPGASRPCAGGNGVRIDRVVKDDVVYQWYAGQGLQIQQLGTFGRANALAKACTEPRPNLRCRPDAMRRALDAVVSLAVERGGFLAWEYYFAFGGGRPPWISGLAQATAMQALVRGYKHFGDPRYLDVARRALGAFRRRAPVGVRVSTDAGSHFLIYSFNPGLRVLNGFLQALVGLYDYAEAAGDEEARRLFASGERQARLEVPRHDTGAWSLYSATTGAESDLGYHRLVHDFLRNLCARIGTEPYCGTEKRFTSYLYEPPKLRFTGRQKAGAATFALSKISCVTLTVERGGQVVTSVSRVLGRGTKQLFWRVPRKGKFVVRVVAQDLMGRRAETETTVTAR